MNKIWEPGELVERLPVGVLCCGGAPGFAILGVNPALLELFGCTREELGQRYADRIYPDDLPVVLAALAGAGDNPVELEYRVFGTGGTVILLLEECRAMTAPDGQQCFLSTLVDITRRKESQEALRLSAERMQVIMDQTNDILFEWDLVQDVIQFSSNWKQRFGYSPIGGEASTRLVSTPNIHPDDREAYLRLLASVQAGAPYTAVEYRILTLSQQYVWHRARATVQYDDQGKPVRAIGVLVDINAGKCREQALLEQTQRDSLTDLYNKAAARTQTELLMESWEDDTLQALMIIDLDNFKAINDRYGHLCGDTVLAELGGCLKRLFRTADNVGRIGGDEFLAYLSGLPDREVATAKAQAIITALAQIPLGETGEEGVSCSIGIAFYPDHGTDYAQLCRCADLALYQVKSQGKCGWAVYDPLLCLGAPPQVPQCPGGGWPPPEEPPRSDERGLYVQLTQYATQLLYSTISTQTAVQQILELIGRTYDVGRVYVYELSRGGTRCSNTFEWCGEGVVPRIREMQDCLTGYGGFNHLVSFDDDGIFYCRNVRLLESPLRDYLMGRGVTAVLQCAIRDESGIQGFAGFEERSEGRCWTQEQIKALAMVSGVLSAFLIKLRLKERLAELEQRSGVLPGLSV